MLSYCGHHENRGDDVSDVEDVVKHLAEGAEGEEEEHVHADQCHQTPGEVRHGHYERPTPPVHELEH